MYSGIYVRQFVLFFGDSIEYEIYIESHDLPVVRDRIVGQELLGDGQDNCFQMLNRLQSDYIYGNVKDLKTDMVEYDKLKRMTTDLFWTVDPNERKGIGNGWFILRSGSWQQVHCREFL